MPSSLAKPGQGIHKYRLGGFAVVDMVLTLVAAFVLAKFVPLFRSKLGFFLRFVLWTLFLVAVGVVVHGSLGIKTALNKKIFSN